jgi:hypothetical protein
MENTSIIIVLLTLITIIMTTVTVQLYRVADKLNKISDRLLIVETEHATMKSNCGKTNDESLHSDIRQFIQDFRIYEKLKEKEHGHG